MAIGRNYLTKGEYVRRAEDRHGKGRYIYDKTEYKGMHSPLDVVCPIHGEFTVHPISHLSGTGCGLCKAKEKSDRKKKEQLRKASLPKKKRGPIRKTTKQFIKDAQAVHGKGRFDYSQTEYVSSRKHLNVICPTHGVFSILPTAHLSGRGCRRCFKLKSAITTETYIERAKKVHGERYLYPLTKYINPTTKIIVACKNHGNFSIFPFYHMQGYGCPSCKDTPIRRGEEKKNAYANYPYPLPPKPKDRNLGTGNKRVFNTPSFLKEAKFVHSRFYTYDKAEYIKSNIKLTVTCKYHGDFQITPSSHLQGAGCRFCANAVIAENRRVR